ncbi:MAG: hypothetical protein OQJ98_00265 [Candidatus Pacebacteria bacterium]|nr:hypothetical protein [Candidatus Paceibacterota bacterium]
MKKFKEKMAGIFFRPKQASRLRGVDKNRGIKPKKQEPKGEA